MGFLISGRGSGKKTGQANYLSGAEHGIRDAARYLNPKKLDVSAASTAYTLARSSLLLATQYLDKKDHDRYRRADAKLKEIGRRIVEVTPTSVVRYLTEAQKNMESGDRIRFYERSKLTAAAELDPDIQKILDEMHAANPGAAEKIRQQEAESKSRMRDVPYTNAGYLSAGQRIIMAEHDLTAAEQIVNDLGEKDLSADLKTVKETVERLKKGLESREKRTDEEL